MNNNNPVTGSTYLVLGILSLVLCPILGPVAWSMSNNALSVLDRYEAQTGDISQRGLVVAGRICGIIGTALFGLSLFLVLVRGCAMSRQSGYNPQDSGMVTIDGRPATPQERQMIEQINNVREHFALRCRLNNAGRPRTLSVADAGAGFSLVK